MGIGSIRRTLLFPTIVATALVGVMAVAVVLEDAPAETEEEEVEAEAKAEAEAVATPPPESSDASEQATYVSEPTANETSSSEAHRREEDRKKVMSAGLRDAMGGGTSSNVFGPGGLGTGINNALGGMHGGLGDAHGVGGLGARGSGQGGGGTGLGPGGMGLGTRGRGGHGPSGGGVQRLVIASPDARRSDPLGADRFNEHGLNGFINPAVDAMSTFAVDVDTASYAIARRMLNEGMRPPPESVRVEEFINYFEYGYRTPAKGSLAVHLEAAPSPFSPGRHLLRVGVQARRIASADRKPTHLTFLVDVSGSMQSQDRLPLAKQALRVLVNNLRPTDSVALVTYAGAVRRVLPQTSVSDRARIHAAIEDLSAGGSTAMGSGLELAYQEARKTLRPGHVSRVIVLSDGDANVGHTHFADLLRTIEGEVRRGVTLTTVGFGMGNYRDDLMEQLADKGNGNSFYVDSLSEARRIFQDRLAGTLEVIAKDVKLQVVFDPTQVRQYRLVGYENRDVADRDFRNDAVDGGEIGAGHSVTALYELELHPDAGEGLARVHVRAKRPEGEKAEEAVFSIEAAAIKSRFEDAAPNLRFAAAVMAFAERLRGSTWAAGWSLGDAARIAQAAMPTGGADGEERAELVRLMRRFGELEGEWRAER